MPEIMIFKDMIDDLGVPFIAYVDAPGHYNDEGDWVPGGESVPADRFGVILPLSDDDLRYAENGTYSTKDRKILTTDTLKEGQKIMYKDITYTVQNFKDLSDYTDVNPYIARWAG